MSWNVVFVCVFAHPIPVVSLRNVCSGNVCDAQAWEELLIWRVVK